MTKVANLAVEVGADITPLTTDMKAAGHSIDRFSKSAERFSRRTERSFQRMNRSSGRLRSGIQNTAFQFQDLAVQISGGTAASRAFAQQMPQLLGGFGALGAVLGAVVAVAIPLRTTMQGMAADGEDVTKVFGTLEPVAKTLATAFQNLGANLQTAIEITINNLDRILITAGTVAALFAGRWVVGIIAARVATFSLAGALVALRGALIRTGIGAIVVAAGELIYQFTRLSEAAGGFGNAVSLLWEVAQETFGRIKDGVMLVGNGFQQLGVSMQAFFVGALHSMLGQFVEFTQTIAQGMNELFGTNLQGLSQNPVNEVFIPIRTGLADRLSGLQATEGDIQGRLEAPFESLQKIRDLLASMKEEKITLPDILGTADDDAEGSGGGGKKTLKEKLTEREQAIAEHMDRIRALTQGGLTGTLGAWGKYFSNLSTLSANNSQKLLGIAKSFGAAQALVDAWRAHNAVLADPLLPWWARVASAVQVLGAGLGAVSAIQGINAGGGASTSSASAGVASTSLGSVGASGGQEQFSREVTVQLTGEGVLGDLARQLIPFLNEAVEDGGSIRFV